MSAPAFKGVTYTSKRELMPKQTPLIFLGDSLFQFHDFSNFGPHHNAGIAGDTTDGILYRLHYTLEKEPSSLVLMIGINDLLQMQYVEIIKENCLKIFKKLDLLDKVYICSILPIEMMDGSFDINEKIIILNHFLKQEALQRGYIYVDIYREMVAEDGGIQKALSSDGLHLTAKAYTILEKVLKDHLQ